MLIQYVQFLAAGELNLICTSMGLGTFDSLGVLADTGDLALGKGA